LCKGAFDQTKTNEKQSVTNLLQFFIIPENSHYSAPMQGYFTIDKSYRLCLFRFSFTFLLLFICTRKKQAYNAFVDKGTGQTLPNESETSKLAARLKNESKNESKLKRKRDKVLTK
jgi:hypothetical protein